VRGRRRLPAHRRHDHTMVTITDLADLAAELSRWETHAAALDPAGIADCLTFDHYGRSHRWSPTGRLPTDRDNEQPEPSVSLVRLTERVWSMSTFCWY
jgi:hypothetical protein